MAGVRTFINPHLWWDLGTGKLFSPTLLEKKFDYDVARDAPLPEPVPPVPQPFIRWNQQQYGGKKFLNDYWENEYKKNPSMDHLILTVELVFGDDTVLFLSNKNITTVSGETGASYSYHGVLMDQISFKNASTIGSSTSRARTFKVSFPNEFLDAIKIIKSDRMLAGYAEVSLQVDGGDYDNRYVMMRGSMDSGVNFGNSDSEVVSVTIVDPKSIMSGALPPYRVPEQYPIPDVSAEPMQPFRFSPWNPWYPSAPSTKNSIDYFNFRMDGLPENQRNAMKSAGSYSGRAYPPAAGIGRTYPIVWNYYDRVPCVPLVRDPHAVSSEFGGDVDDAYKDATGADEYCDFNCFYVVAYGHGHKFKIFWWDQMSDWSDTWGEDMFGDPNRGARVSVYLSVPQMREVAQIHHQKLVDEAGVLPVVAGSTLWTYEYGYSHQSTLEGWGGWGMPHHIFEFYEGGERRIAQDIFGVWDASGEPIVSLSNAFGETFPCILMEVYDPKGVPITVLRMSPKEGAQYTSSITMPMISSIGSVDHSNLDSSVDNPSSVINCAKYFAETFTTLGHIALDEQLFANAQSKLSNMTVSGIVNGSGEKTQAQTVSFIEGQLLKPFPMIGMTFTGRGYGPIVFDRRNETNGEYLVGQGMFIDRISNVVETPKTKMFNDYTLRYAYDFDENTYAGTVSRNSGNNIFCKISEEEAGRRTRSPIDSNWVYDRSIAEFCIDWLCAHTTLPSYSVSYLTEVWAFFRHQVGDNIKITDPKLGLEDVTATITGIRYTPEACEVTLVLWLYYTKLDGGATNFPLPTLEGEGESLSFIIEDAPPQQGPQG